MANFDAAIGKVLKAEGGYSTSKADKGNYACGIFVGTNYGISAPVLQDYLGQCPSAQAMKNLSKSTAKKIYRAKYWDRIGGNNLKSQSVADIVFDASVNHGVYKTADLTEDTLREMGVDQRVKVPFSTNVTDAINSVNQKAFFENFKKKREAEYRRIGGSFLKGWLNRLNAFTYSTLRNPIAAVTSKTGIIILITTFALTIIILLILRRQFK